MRWFDPIIANECSVRVCFWGVWGISRAPCQKKKKKKKKKKKRNRIEKSVS